MTKLKILLTGGAGYIGSCTANILLDHGCEVFIIDDLSTGHKKLVPKKSNFYQCSIQSNKVSKILEENNFDVVMHFAAFIQVEESTKYPRKYIKNNYENTVKFLKKCKKYNLKNIIISSTAAVYGNSSKKKTFNEISKLNPSNPYAKSKLKIEKYIKKNKYFNFIILRYFNVAGADLKLRSGQISKKSTHLIKKLCQSSLNNKPLPIFGSDYLTKDGTAIRDYIHVIDLANIHYLAAKYLLKKNKSQIFNCGYGYGFTVKEVVDTFNKISKNKINYIYRDRRAGDVGVLISNSNKIKKILKWKSKYESLKEILKSHLQWEKKINNE